jgi:L-serine dehydratase
MRAEDENESESFLNELDYQDAPQGWDRRAFMMRSALASAVVMMTGRPMTAFAQQPPTTPQTPPGTPPAPPLDPSLDVHRRARGPIQTTLEEFYKVGPGPSSSHTIGPMRITYNFYQLCSQLPAAQLSQATAIKAHLFGSLSSTGRGHGTERAALAGIIGMEPATTDPAFLDGLVANPNQTFPVTLGATRFNASLADIIYDAPQGNFHHPNTMKCKLMAGERVLFEKEYYSVGGGFIEWENYTPPQKNPPRYPYQTMAELLAHARQNNLSVAQIAMANETAITGKSEADVNRFLDTTLGAMRAIVRTGLAAPMSVLPGPIQLKTKAGDVFRRAGQARTQAGKSIGLVTAYALAGSEENARGHLVVTAPTGGSAGVIPAIAYALGEEGARLPDDKIRNGLMAAAVIGYLGKHNATLSGAEGGCQAEIGVASSMGAAMIGQALDADPQVVANAAESALEHHLGMTCDPVAGFVQVPCIERCAYGAVKAWTGYLIASNEIPANRRLDFDTTMNAMALTAREMNSKYKETSEGGLAVSVVLC